MSTWSSGAILVGDVEPTRIGALLTESAGGGLFTYSGVLRNVGNQTAYIGQSDVTKDTGFPLNPGDVLEHDQSSPTEEVALYAIADNGATELRWLLVT